MQKSRRDFAKKMAMAVAGSTVLGATAVLANTESETVESLSNGVVVGNSNKKEIIYKKTGTWEAYYKNAL